MYTVGRGNVKELPYPMNRENWQDYIDQKCIMYCPPTEYSPEIKSTRIQYSYFGATSVRFLASPQYLRPTPKLMKAINIRGYALDNGAYMSFLKKTSFDQDLFLKMCMKYGASADWIVLPDVVGSPTKTINQARYWTAALREILPDSKLLFVFQDGMERRDLEQWTKKGIGLFVGGTTKGKMENMNICAELCRNYGVWCHVGRVNTIKRLKHVLAVGAHSFDGSGIVRFLPTLELLTNYLLAQRRQFKLFEKDPFDNIDLSIWLKKRREKYV